MPTRKPTRAVAYLRRSAAYGTGADSYQDQERAVLDLARRQGHPDPEIVVDWGRSGAGSDAFTGTRRGGNRPAWAELRERIDAGAVDALYAYSLSRLARSTRELLDLAESCAAQGVTVHVAKEGTLDFGTAAGRMYLTVLGAVATYEADQAAERARERIARKRAQGEHVGRPPFGYRVGDDGRLVPHDAEKRALRAVLAAIESQGGYTDAAALLNEQGVPTRSGRPWSDTMVYRVAARARGEHPESKRTGTSRYRTRTLSRLLACGYCGRTLTAHQNKPGSDWVGWYCHNARTVPGHPRPASIPNAVALDLVRAEIDRLVVPVDVVELAEQAQDDLADLDARRARLVDAVERGTLADDDVRDRLASIESERARLEARTTVQDVPQAVDWSAPEDAVNAVLRAVLERVTVDLADRTIDATWRDETLRGG